MRTPNLDRFATQSACFEQAFSSCPLCSPYRAQLLTGRYAHANGCPTNGGTIWPGIPTFPEALGAAGYTTAYIGKLHLGEAGPYPREKRFGFDYMAAYYADNDFYSVSYYENERGPHPIEDWEPLGDVDLSLGFIEKHIREAPDRPFALFMSWGAPHWSTKGVSEILEGGHALGLNSSYDRYPQEFNIYGSETLDVHPNVPESMSDFSRKELAQYYGNISALDHGFGRMMGFLEERNLAENTIICFSSDHGDLRNSHGTFRHCNEAVRQMWSPQFRASDKHLPYEEAVHVPFLLRYDGAVAPGQRINTLFNSVDVMPTLLSLAGIDPPPTVQGRDLSHSVLGKEGPEPDSVYLQGLGPHRRWNAPKTRHWRGVRDHRWLYARWYGGNQTWLFDRQNDPWEMVNLAGESDYADVQSSMEEKLRTWMRRTGDGFDDSL